MGAFSFLGSRTALMPNDLHLHQKQPEYFDSTEEASLVSKTLTAITVDKGHQNRFQQENQIATTITQNSYFKDLGKFTYQE